MRPAPPGDPSRCPERRQEAAPLERQDGGLQGDETSLFDRTENDESDGGPELVRMHTAIAGTRRRPSVPRSQPARYRASFGMPPIESARADSRPGRVALSRPRPALA
jgi:hypothetical protein